MEKCPKCKQNTLDYDTRQKMAQCYNVNCDFFKYVADYDNYFRIYVISKLNWGNYCSQTPAFIREIRGTIKPNTWKRLLT